MFLGNYWSDIPIFRITTTEGSRSIISQILARRNFFSDLLAEKYQFSELF